MSIDVGLTHIALPATDLEKSIAFYSHYAHMVIVHDRINPKSGNRIVWLSDKTRHFVIVLYEISEPETTLKPFAHLGVGCASKEEVDKLCQDAKKAGFLLREPTDSGYPAGYWAFLRDPDGHTLELAYGQEVGLTIDKYNPEV